MSIDTLSGKRERRRRDTPSNHVARIAWTLLTLLYDGVLEYAVWVDRFGISKREFQRDLLKLREIGKTHGFGVSRMTSGRVFAHTTGQHANRLSANRRDLVATLGRIAAALGGPIELEMRDAIGDDPPEHRRGFLHVREALPVDGQRVAGIFSFLKEAAAGPARVEFSYKSARGARTIRRVEPYHVVARSGRCYLVGYDLDRRDWRHFALDAISGPMRKVGTFTSRTVPDRLLSERSVGWISGLKTTEVSIHVSPVIAAAVSSRKWQDGQRIRTLPDGGAEITFAVDDLDEAVRWALGFGSEAVIIAPPEAVALARQTVDRIALHYSDEAAPAPSVMTG